MNGWMDGSRGGGDKMTKTRTTVGACMCVGVFCVSSFLFPMWSK